MFGFEHQTSLMMAYGTAMLEASARLTTAAMAMTEQSMSCWPGSARPSGRPAARATAPSARPQVRSWYRNPTEPVLFDPVSWFTAAAWSTANAAPWLGAWPVAASSAARSMPNPFTQGPFGSASAFAPFLGPAAPLLAFAQPMAWLIAGAGRPYAAAPANAVDAFAAALNPFSNYRSDGGHAVAQIKLAKDRTDPNPAWTALMTMPAFAPWFSRSVH